MAVARSELHQVGPAAPVATEARARLVSGAADDALAGLQTAAFQHGRPGQPFQVSLAQPYHALVVEDDRWFRPTTTAPPSASDSRQSAAQMTPLREQVAVARGQLRDRQTGGPAAGGPHGLS